MRVRFAPSPTGALHIGGARTALYNWLLARGGPHGPNGEEGTFVLRIEDTDRERSTPENVEQILDALRWLNLDWDEGPVFQSQRAGRHREALEELLASGRAYHSSATAQEVRAYKERHGWERGFRGEPESAGAVRLRYPDAGETGFDDVVRGKIRFANSSRDDPVIARADGSLLYNFAVAVDDLDAGITHVVRGEDHISNTPTQLLVFDALGVPPPVYAHLPLLYGPDGRKLSKRHGAASVQELRAAGYLPEAVDNYIALLGAGFSADEEHFSLQELAKRFRLERVSKNPAIFDEQKLRHMNGRHLRELGIDELTRRLEEYTGRHGLRGAVEISAEKIQTLADFWPLVSFLFDGPVDDARAFQKVICSDGGVENLEAAREALASAEPFTVENVEAALRGVVEALGAKPGKVFQPVRVAIAGTTVSPGIFESVALLGQEETLARIDRALDRAGARKS
ncbi:MAG: glutamate--tRNA ligase [Solirubrobacterales bacterium]|nr:glutamate--tRNA ligase [Solirubrobacterales bacterium]MBV9801428.1 glutamate--tRNA ligase [Solirubrobacterales bacterium]